MRRHDPPKRARRPRRPKMSAEASNAASYLDAQMRELGLKTGYIALVNIGPYDLNPHDMPLPTARFPKLFRALYEAVEYAESQLRYHDKIKIQRLEATGEEWPPFYATVVWRSWGQHETEDRRRQHARRRQIETARRGRTLEHVSRDRARARRRRHA